MVIGVTLFRMNGTPYWGPTLARAGLSATFAVQVTHTMNAPTLDVTVEHRNSDETGWTVAGIFAPIGAPGVFPLDVSGLKELVRLSYVVGGATPEAAVHVIPASPAWRPY